jgi:hypothetical protein
MTDYDKFVSGEIFRVQGSAVQYRYIARNGEFSSDIIQRNVSTICFDFKDFCVVSVLSKKGIIYAVSAFEKVLYNLLHFEEMIFEEGGDDL